MLFYLASVSRPVKLFCFPVEIQHREFDSKLILAARLADLNPNHACLIGFDRYFSQILDNSCASFLLDKSMSTIMLKARIQPCKKNNGVVFISDEEGVNDLDETPAALDIRADNSAVPYIDQYLAWGDDDSSFYGNRKSGLSSKITICGSHRYDLLNDIGMQYFAEEVSSIKTLFGNFILFNDNLAVDHYDKSYKVPTKLFNSKPEQSKLADIEWSRITTEHSERRAHVKSAILRLADFGFNIVVRPHPVYDSIFWHESFRLHSRIQTIYSGNVEPWIHAADAVITTGCTTGLQALLAGKPSYELPVGHSKAYSSSILPECRSPKNLLPHNMAQDLPRFRTALQQVQKRWSHGGSSTLKYAELIDSYSDKLSNRFLIEDLNNIRSLDPKPPKWRSLTTPYVNTKLETIKSILHLNSTLKVSKVAKCLYCVHSS